MNPGDLSTYSAVFIENGQIRRLWFQAAGEPEAQAFCTRWGAGYEGPSEKPASDLPPVAVNAKTARQMMGGVSDTTLWREVVAGRLERVPNTRRVLITTRSLASWGRA